MYTTKNFRSKKELKLAVEAWNVWQERDPHMFEGICQPPCAVTYFQPGPFGGNEPRDGTIYCEGPHYPQPHRWYAACDVRDGVIVKVK